MGVIDLYFVDNEVEVCCRRKVVDCTFYIFLLVGPLPLGARLVLPMGVAPEAIAKKFRV
jgi:hypothetical protein